MFCAKHHHEGLAIGDRLVCPACLAEGSRQAVRLVTAARERSTQAQSRLRREAADLPAAFVGATFENFDPPSARAAKLAGVLRGYSASFASRRSARPGFLFTGAPGTGKTHLACAMVNLVIEAGHSAAYVSLPRHTARVRASFGKSGAVEGMTQKLLEVDLLVIDEIDLHGTSDNDYLMLYDVINGRYERSGFPTLAISNRPLERLRVDLDERLVSRLLADTEPFVFDWPGQRRRQHAAVASGASR